LRKKAQGTAQMLKEKLISISINHPFIRHQKMLSKKKIEKKVFNNQGFTLGFDFNKICKFLIFNAIQKFKFSPLN
jgi:hypothetical protein